MLLKKLKILSALCDGFPRGAYLDSVVLRCAPSLRQVGVESGCLGITAGISRKVLLIHEVWPGWMIAAVIYLGTDELFVAVSAPEFL